VGQTVSRRSRNWNSSCCHSSRAATPCPSPVRFLSIGRGRPVRDRGAGGIAPARRLTSAPRACRFRQSPCPTPARKSVAARAFLENDLAQRIRSSGSGPALLWRDWQDRRRKSSQALTSGPGAAGRPLARDPRQPRSAARARICRDGAEGLSTGAVSLVHPGAASRGVGGQSASI